MCAQDGRVPLSCDGSVSDKSTVQPDTVDYSCCLVLNMNWVWCALHIVVRQILHKHIVGTEI
jgi:hypothetical protein